VRSSLPHERHGALVEFRFGRSSSTISAFCLVTGRAFGAAEAGFLMWKRTLFVLALALAVGICRAPAPAAPAIGGTADVRVLDVRFVPAGEAGPGLAAGGPTYVLATVELTNDTVHDFTPDVGRFFLTAARNERYQGTEGGSSALAGVSNSHRMLKQGDKRDYTVGFRTADPVVTGTISYEP
jgi:hypothetical protein